MTRPLSSFEEREPVRTSGFLSLDFQKGTWTLPKVPPQKSASSIELFAVWVQRHLEHQLPNPHRLKLFDEQDVVCVPGPAEGPSKPKKSMAKFREEHKELFERAKATNLRPPPAHLAGSEPTAAELDIERPFGRWELVSAAPFTPEWNEEVRRTSPFGSDTQVHLGVLPDSNGEFRGFTYALRHKHDTMPIRDDELKHLPLRAMAPGMQRWQINHTRRLFGKEPLPRPASSSSTSQARSSG